MNNATDWELYCSFAEAAFLKNNLTVAEVLIRHALDCAYLFPPDDPRLISTVDHLGDILFAQGRFDEALTEFKCAYTLTNGDNQTPSLDSITLGQKLASCHIHKGEFAEAKNILTGCLATCSEFLGKGHDFTVAIAQKVKDLEEKQVSISSPVRLFNLDQGARTSMQPSPARTSSAIKAALNDKTQTT
ncbi:MAG: hypothetical protein HC888_06200 [Candidatus Competibacteraceae bacterium]|nr:hypothetical protein [Candidatus Competibacteraceae bacterium]